MPRVQVIIRVIGDGGDLAHSEFTISEVLTRTWCGSDVLLEDPFNLAQDLGLTFRDSLRSRIEHRISVSIPETIQVEVRRADLNPSNIDFANLEARELMNLPYGSRRELFERLGLDEDATLEVLEATIGAPSEPIQRSEGVLVSTIPNELAEHFRTIYGDSIQTTAFVQVKTDRTAIPTRYRRNPVI